MVTTERLVKKVSPLFIPLALAACILSAPRSAATAELEIKWDKAEAGTGGDADNFFPVGGGPLKDALDAKSVTKLDDSTRGTAGTRWATTDLVASQFDVTKFGSVDADLGAVHENKTGKKITDVHLKLLNGDTFKNTSTGGNAFPNVTISGNGKEIDFTGGDIPVGKFLWSRMPKITYGQAEGKLTDAAPPPKEKKDAEAKPKAKSSSSSCSYDSTSGTLSFSANAIDAIIYDDGSTSDPNETLLGATVTLDPVTFVGPSGDVPGAYEFTDGTITIAQSSTIFMEGALTDVLVIPDNSVPGYDSVVQATLVWDYYESTQSDILDELYDFMRPIEERVIVFNSNLLSQTVNLTTSTTGPISCPEAIAPVLASPPLDHFQCYEMPRAPFDRIAGVSLADAFGASTVDVIRPKRLCNPADKNNEDPTAPNDPDHLTGYIIKQRSPAFAGASGVSVTNQFGTVTLNMSRPDYLLVPTAKSLSAPPAPLSGPIIDHFKCYRVTQAQARVSGLSVADEFGTLIEDVKRPLRLCMPADKNGEGIPDPAAHLLCYKIRQTSLPVFRGIAPIYITNQFGASTVAVDHLRELCVPSSVVVP